MVDYISAKETAKFIRSVLKQHFKKNFPNTKFSVRMDGNSLDIRWIDGPTQKMVDAVVGVFQGGGFDGSIDMSYSCTAYLCEDGTVIEGNCSGTVGSGGYIQAYNNEMPAGAREVHFGARFIFTHRNYSERFVTNAINSYKCKHPEVQIKLWVSKYDQSAGATIQDHNTEVDFRGFMARRVVAA